MLLKRLMIFTFLTGLSVGVSSGFDTEAQAGVRSYSDVRATKITAPGESTHSRSVVIPYGKSTMIDVPGGMMDVIVSNPDIVDAVVHTSERVLLRGKGTGQTNAYIYGHNGEEILNLELRVERDLSGLRALFAKHAPGSQIEVAAYNNNILLSGTVADAATSNTVVNLAKMWLDEDAGGKAGEITNLMTISGNDQVMIKVRIVEMQRSVTKQMGIDFNAVGKIGDANIGLISNSALSTGAGFNGSLNWVNSGGGALRSLTSSLQALERVGLVRTQAEPTITTISGETANFISGGEFPLLTNVFIDDNGRLQREFEYKKFGVALGVTPIVLSEGRIQLNLSASVSEPTTEGAFETGGNDILAIRNREVNTVVELPAGGSMVIAGLIRRDSRQSTDGTPGLKDVPGVGALFRNRDDESTETELVIMVTPYLVKPTHPDKLQTPLDGFVGANDRDVVLLGRLNKVYGKNRSTDKTKTLSGPFGHVID
ncbi:MAG TPA: type II and III secretion system protein family protein [Hellea balneolensis]|uniref:Type II and III secretion system protein family protein n=1 Tax=Hellea balneolensis TaxID=287478 RepID=A0A7C5R0L9_9PROT|nr:type II and III secretion system protein family protein [Hellea balneolensis]